MTTELYRAPKLARLALRLFPGAFRARYGHDLLQCIRDARRDLSNETLVVTIRFWIMTACDLAWSALIERIHSMPRESWALVSRRIAGVLLIGAAVVNVAYDAISIKLSMGVFAALLTAVGALIGILLLRSGPGRGVT